MDKGSSTVVDNGSSSSTENLPPGLRSNNCESLSLDHADSNDEMTSETTTTVHTAMNHVSTTSAASASASALIISAADKAGMDGIDRSRINEIILRESGDSAYMLQQKKRDAKVNVRIDAMKRRLQRRNSTNTNNGSKDNSINIDDLLASYQRRQQTSRSTCLVLDMDMYYMACELLSRPDLEDKPACVGRGMILTSNYVARRYGVRAAMPGFIGDKLVEELSDGKEKLIHVPSNFDLYKKKADLVRDVLREYDPNMKSYSLDEAYLDIGPYLALYLRNGSILSHDQIKTELMKQIKVFPKNDGTSDDKVADPQKQNGSNDKNGDDNHNNVKDHEVSTSALSILQSFSSMVCMQALDKIVQGLRQKVEQATGLTCSVGVGPNFSVAKIASDKNKPNGQLLVDPSHVLDFIRPLPVRKVPGIGRVMEKVLQQVCNVETVQDLYDQRHLVYWLFGHGASSSHLLRASVGCSGSMTSSSDFGAGNKNEGQHPDDAVSGSADHQKGISRERTFSPDDSWTNLNMKLEDIARMVYSDMQRKSIVTHTITVKVKLKSFDVLSRAHSLPKGTYIETPKQLVDLAAGIFSQIRSSYFNKIDEGEFPKKERRQFVVRLLGIRCSNLIDISEFQSLKAGRLDKFLAVASPNDEENTENPSGFVDKTGKPKDVINLDAKKTSTHSSNGSVKSPQNKSPRRTPETSPLAKSSSILTAATTATATPKRMESQKSDIQIGVDGDNTACDDQEEKQEVFCPVCNRGFFFQDNNGLNSHLDTCLSSSVVRETIKEEDSRIMNAESSRKRQRLTDFFERAPS
mmetsp:Transcript_43925/g.106505  ORF Transcript_43925/g.106505 Transcript_43925/m.106505 type:complete len:805 (+) Transcript_43925:292-2706(+)